METLKDYLIKITANTSGVKEANQHLDRMEKQIGNLAKRVAFAMIGFRGLTQTLFKAANAIKAEVKETITLNDNLAKTAKDLKKTTEQARLHQIALSSMGKTMKEINKDKELKKTYNELVKIGEAFEFKQAPDGVTRIKDLKSELTKIKFSLKLGLSQVYEWFKVYAAEPLKQIRNWLKDFAAKLGTSIGELSKKIGEWLAKALKELMQIAMRVVEVAKTLWDWGTRLLKWIDSMSASAKAFSAVIIGIIALITGKLKPLHVLLTAIYLLVEDFAVWAAGGKSFFGNAWQGVIDMFKEIKGFFSGDFGKVAAAGGLAALLFGKGEGLKNAFEFLSAPLGQAVGTLLLIYGTVKGIETIINGEDSTVGDAASDIVSPFVQAGEWIADKLGLSGDGVKPSEALKQGWFKEAFGYKIRENLAAGMNFIKKNIFGGLLDDGERYTVEPNSAGGVAYKNWSNNGGVQDLGSGVETAPGVFTYTFGSGGGGNAYPAYTNGTTNNTNNKNVTINNSVTQNIQSTDPVGAGKESAQAINSMNANELAGAIQ